MSAEVNSFKKIVYDRVDDADVKVTATGQIAAMYIRKQGIFTEKRIFRYVTIDDLRLDLLPRMRKMTTNNMEGIHSWESMSDEELLRSAGLFGIDRITGDRGYNLAAVMLLGKDDVIKDICPAYETDALVRKVNVDRYDDREIVKTNLIESYDQLMEFARKNLPDKFFLEGTERKNLRNIISRELIGNVLIHREFTSAYTAKFVIEKNRMYTENGSRSAGDGIITPDNMEPNPKNPIIASFFRTIGWSDRLGSGVRNLYKYSKIYSGQEPEFVEGDIFKTVVPLDDEYSPDTNTNGKATIKSDDKKATIKSDDKKATTKTEKQYEQILSFMEVGEEYSLKEFCDLLGLKETRTKELLRGLSDQIEIKGRNKDRKYKLKKLIK